MNVSAWKSIEIERIDDEPISINLSDDLELSFTATHLVADSREYNLEIPIAKLKGFQASHTSNSLQTGIEEAEIDSDFSFRSDRILFSNPSDLKLYSLDGKLIYSQNNCRELNIDLLSEGIYVVVVNNLSFKIKK